MVWDILNYAGMVCFWKTSKRIIVWWGGVWSKSSISQKIVPGNRNSKSLEGKQFINVRWRPSTACGAIAWSKLMHICVPLPFICHFLAERFHTLKFELDFFSRQGHLTLYWTGVYNRILLIEKQRRSSFFFWRAMVKLYGNSINVLHLEIDIFCSQQCLWEFVEER